MLARLVKKDEKWIWVIKGSMVVERQVVVGDVHRPSNNIISKQQMIYLSKTKYVFK